MIWRQGFKGLSPTLPSLASSWVRAGGEEGGAIASLQNCMLLLLLPQGILAGCWVVSSAWVAACCQAGGALLPEEPFEVLGDGSSGSNGGGCGGSDAGGTAAKAAMGGPAKGRQAKAEGRAPLLSGWRVFVLGSGPVKDSCVTLVKAAGGSVAARLPPALLTSQQQTQQQQQQTPESPVGTGDEGQMLVLVPEGSAAAAGSSGGCSGSSKGQKGHAEALGLPVLRQKWLMDCVSHMELLPIDGYRV